MKDHVPQGALEWYTSGISVSRSYLNSLLQANSLFSSGVTSIPHGRRDGFYTNLMKENLPGSRALVSRPAAQLELDIEGIEDEQPQPSPVAPLALENIDDDGDKSASASERRERVKRRRIEKAESGESAGNESEAAEISSIEEGSVADAPNGSSVEERSPASLYSFPPLSPRHQPPAPPSQPPDDPMPEPPPPSLPRAPPGSSGITRSINPESVGEWGVFKINFTQSKKGHKFGSWVARCPFHASLNKSGKTVTCSKSCALVDESEKEDVLLRIQHWCNQARDYDRKYLHQSLEPRDTPVPDLEVVYAQVIFESPGEVLPDEVLDGMDKSGDDAAAAAKPKRPRRGRASGRVRGGATSSAGPASSAAPAAPVRARQRRTKTAPARARKPVHQVEDYDSSEEVRKMEERGDFEFLDKGMFTDVESSDVLDSDADASDNTESNEDSAEAESLSDDSDSD